MSAKSIVAPPASIAVIGLGNMGIPMAGCLLRAGFLVTGFDLLETARQKFRATGGHVADSAADTVRSADVIITLLPDGKSVRTVLAGLEEHITPASIIIDMSSSDPVGTRELGEKLLAAGFEFIDAPISGGVKRAVNGTLTIMVGGDDGTIHRVENVLSAMGSSIFRTGAIGSGHAMKALNNYVSAAGLVAVVEAIRIGKKFGLDPDIMADILNVSSGRNNTTEVKLKQFILSKKFDAGFPMKLMAKDIRTADNLSHAMGVKTPLADACANIWDEATKAFDERADHTAIGMYLDNLGR